LSNAEYAFMSAYLKGAESQSFTADDVNRLSRTASVADVMEVIGGTEVGKYLESVAVKTFDDIDRYLWQYFSQCLERLDGLRLMPLDMRKVLDVYRVKYDIINIKAMLQTALTGKQAYLIPIGVIYNRGLLDELSRAETTDRVISLLVECGLSAYASILREYDIGAETKQRLRSESEMDEEYFKSLAETAKDVEDGFIMTRVFGLIIDLTNLKIVSRSVIEETGNVASCCIIHGGYLLSNQILEGIIAGKLTDIPGAMGSTPYRAVADELISEYNRTKSITAIEETIDRHQLAMLRENLSPRIMSPLVIVWYLTVKEMEIRNLRLILKAALDGISIDDIKDYLVF